MLQKSRDPKDTKIISYNLSWWSSNRVQKANEQLQRLVDYYGTFDYEYFFWDSDATTKSRLLSHLARGSNSEVVFGT